MAALILVAVIAYFFFVGYLAGRPNRVQKRTLRAALDAYLSQDGLADSEREDAMEMRYSKTLRE